MPNACRAQLTLALKVGFGWHWSPDADACGQRFSDAGSRHHSSKQPLRESQTVLTAEQVLARHPEWYHSIELAPGMVTPGRAPLSHWQDALHALHLPSLTGKRVLDIGAYDGFFSFASERLGASRVVALDHYAWATDMVAYMRDWRASRDAGRELPAPHLTAHWHPDVNPGRAPFDAAREVLASRVEPAIGDFMTMPADTLGVFDIVLFLGVLYHLEEPLTALRRVFELTAPGGMAIIETEAVEIPGSGARALCEFFPSDELNHDSSNWWSPNRQALLGMCRAAGFVVADAMPMREPRTRMRRAAKRAKLAVASVPFSTVPFRYRLVVHATRAASD